MKEQVILINPQGEEAGLMEKMEAHEKGLLHKAFSVILFNSKNEMLLQQRSAIKYHWPLIWSNACCSHPRSGESSHNAAIRRLREELGIETDLDYAFTFQYKARDSKSGLTEHERDDVFIGEFNGEIPYNLDEVAAVKWMSISDVELELKTKPDEYSVWFAIIFEEMKKRNLLNL